MTENELIQGCKDKKEDFQKLLFDLYSGKMMAVCNRYCTDKQQAQDLLQEGFIKVFRSVHQFRFEGSFEGWLRSIFVTGAIREINKKRIVFKDIHIGNLMDYSVEPSVVSKMSEAEIKLMISSMPEGYRTVFNLHVIEGYSHDEIARILKIQPSTSRVQLMKAKKYLQALLLKKNRKEKHEQHI